MHFESEILSRAHKNFSFVNGRYVPPGLGSSTSKTVSSIGNYFLSAAQAFFRSLPSAIFLFSSITNSQANILPVIVTNHTVTIAAELVRAQFPLRASLMSIVAHTLRLLQENGERLVGIE